MAAISIIDDDAGFRDSLAETLTDFGHAVTAYDRAGPAIAAIAATLPDLVFLDLRMPEMDGIAALRAIRAAQPTARVVVLTAFATGNNTIDAMRLGAFDHLTKPVGRAALQSLLQSALRHAEPQARAEPAPPGTIIGTSPAIRDVQKRIGLAAAGDASVLILGETGVGKELVAQAIHRFSARAAKPFVAVNCAAIPADLLESELFGHERGAFTGATTAQRGRFREADGGTLLLDEIGDMPLATQAKILRALQEREVTPLGGAPVKIDARIIAATHQNLQSRVTSGQFRADLYYRLAVIPIEVPKLRDRGADILLLARHILNELRPAQPLSLTDAAEHALLAYPWPGNVRELRNTLERAASLTPSGVIDAADLALNPPAMPGAASPGPTNLPEAVAATEIALIRAALITAQGNRTEAARALGISRQALYDRINRYGTAIMSDLPTPAVGNPDDEA
ncbi:sigma-54 dependent transcriptional regulator [Acidiphilium sp. PA]|uniref:sigma-54-dependent transcriptional regulator n=1 Tax=Acidiphilium sp. PA TaxID=2871705 RepID=UPI002244D4AD|nr:sigma-54 dependent transcriptional regulator [Acidiphilium sp. PA]MCW8306726.1 sigma-54 dependent transcriptional regulator [Acidiphilium sp. PA]